MLIRIFISSGDVFYHEVPDEVVGACHGLPAQADRFEFWRRATGNDKIVGHAMVWEIVEKQTCS